MELHIDITRPLNEQFDALLKVATLSRSDSPLGSTTNNPIRVQFFPGELELYHFPAAEFSEPIEMKSTNPPESEWFIAHINLSATRQRKSVDGRSLEFQKHLPIGLLVYGRGLEIDTVLPPNVESEVASVRFSARFLDNYIDGWRETGVLSKSLVHEELDHRLESLLTKAIASLERRTECHAATLSFIALLFERLETHAKCGSPANLSSSEIGALFRAAAPLRDPLLGEVPSVSELAKAAGMGTSKFKAAFKQVFGDTPMRYRNRLRMEFARQLIQEQDRSPTDVSYLLGYSHPSNFTLAYKKHFGVVPSRDHD